MKLTVLIPKCPFCKADHELDITVYKPVAPEFVAMFICPETRNMFQGIVNYKDAVLNTEINKAVIEEDVMKLRDSLDELGNSN